MKSYKMSKSFVSLCAFSLCAFGLLMSACASYEVALPEGGFYNEGVQILDSNKSRSKVRIEVGESRIGGSSTIPLALFISAQNLTREPVLFDRYCVNIIQGNKVIMPLEDKALKKESYDYGAVVEAFHLYVPPTPLPNNPSPMIFGSPFIYRGFWGGFYPFGVYDYAFFSARDRMQQHIRLEDERARKAIIVSSSLQKNTLQDKPKGGFVIFNPKKLKKGKIQLQVRVGDDIHIFMLELKK